MSTSLRTPFGARSTAAEVLAGVDLSGKRAVVTGASSGIGIETARALAAAGAAVTLAVRDTARGAEVADDIVRTTGNKGVDAAPIELADPASVDAFARAWTGPLHILVNNAGIMAVPERTLTPYGQELHFATNHLGHFRLAVDLHRALAAAGGARIVSVSSAGNLVSPVNFDDLTYNFIPYDGISAYGQSKTANVLFAVGVGQRWADDGIVANALMPGAVNTRLMRHVDPAWFEGQEDAMPIAVKTPEQGAATSALLAGSPLVEGVTGRYFEDVNEAETVTERGSGGSGVAPYALDPGNAERLWVVSSQLVGIA